MIRPASYTDDLALMRRTRYVFIIESDVDRVEHFRLTLRFLTTFRWRRNLFFNSDFKFFDDAPEFSVTSLYIVFIFSSKFVLIFLQSVFYWDRFDLIILFSG